LRYYAGNYQKDTINGTWKKIHYIMGGTGLVAVYIKWSTGVENMYYVCKDRQGSIMALVKQDGTIAEKYSYDAWGRRRNPTNWADYNVPAPSLINRGYTGHEMLDGFGLINMNGRMYDPVIGRVLSPDAFVQDPGSTQSYNRYSYCRNNPLRYTDPSGWLMAPADQYWNLDKDITDFVSFSGRRAGDFGGGGGQGWGGIGGVVPGGGGGYSSGFGQQLYAAANNLCNSNAPDGVYNLTGINYNNGTYEFSYKYNLRATININAAEAYRNRDAQIIYDNSLIAGPGGISSTSKTRLEAMNEALAAFGIATSGVESFTGANASSRIVYCTINGTTSWLSKTEVLEFLKGAAGITLVVSTTVDITRYMQGDIDMPLIKVCANFGIGVLGIIIKDSSTGLLVTGGYLLLDKMGAFNIPSNIPSYSPQYNVPDATNARPIFTPLPK